MKKKSNSILALIPQNNEGLPILKEALYFQQVLGTKIVVLNNIEDPPFLFQTFQTEKLDQLKEKAKQSLKDFVKNVIQEEDPDTIMSYIKTGNTVSNLIEESNTGDYDFIIIDKNKSSFTGGLLWKQIDKFVSLSRCPVLAINKDFPIREIKKIVIPIDISQSIKERLYWATLFAKKFNAKIIIVSALNIDINKKDSLAYKNASEIGQLFHEQNVEHEIKILKVHNQEKHTAFLEYLKEEKPELVVIRTHQDSVFSGTNIGRFVSEVLHGCEMPVFTVNYTPDTLQSIFSLKF